MFEGYRRHFRKTAVQVSAVYEVPTSRRQRRQSHRLFLHRLFLVPPSARNGRSSFSTDIAAIVRPISHIFHLGPGSNVMSSEWRLRHVRTYLNRHQAHLGSLVPTWTGITPPALRREVQGIVSIRPFESFRHVEQPCIRSKSTSLP